MRICFLNKNELMEQNFCLSDLSTVQKYKYKKNNHRTNCSLEMPSEI